jgi:hypothetical protein
VIYRFRAGLFESYEQDADAEAHGTLTIGAYKIVLLRNGKAKKKKGLDKPPREDGEEE